MGKVLYFSPKSEIDSSKNLQAFIHMCRYELTIFGENLDWDSYAWPDGNRFTKLGVGSGKLDFKKVGLAEEFLDFAKAYVRYGYAHRPRRTRTVELITIKNHKYKVFLVLA